MLLHLLPRMRGIAIILASASPRRRELLAGIMGVNFTVVPSTFDENLDKAAFKDAQGYVLETARRKTMDVIVTVLRTSTPADIVIGADTVVVCDGVILEKPRDADDARSMLRRLSGREHTVLTAVVVVRLNGATGIAETLMEVVATQVHFATLPDELIDAYIATGEPFDKAGGYGIQARAGTFVDRISGCYYNVVGFPVHTVSRMLAAAVAPLLQPV